VGVTAADGGDEPIARGWAAEVAAGQIVLPGLFHLTLVQHELGFGGGGAPGAVLELVGEGADIAGGIPEGEVVGWEHPGPLWQDVAQLGQRTGADQGFHLSQVLSGPAAELLERQIVEVAWAHPGPASLLG
jgi:hypothetical protein